MIDDTPTRQLHANVSSSYRVYRRTEHGRDIYWYTWRGWTSLDYPDLARVEAAARAHHHRQVCRDHRAMTLIENILAQGAEPGATVLAIRRAVEQAGRVIDRED